jgi:hypothetical protein
MLRSHGGVHVMVIIHLAFGSTVCCKMRGPTWQQSRARLPPVVEPFTIIRRTTRHPEQRTCDIPGRNHLMLNRRTLLLASGAYRASTRALISRCRAVRPRTDRGQSGTHRLGLGLAAPEFGDAARPQGQRRDAAVPDRRRPAVEPASGLGAGRVHPQDDPGRQSRAAVRVLISTTAMVAVAAAWRMTFHASAMHLAISRSFPRPCWKPPERCSAPRYRRRAHDP